MLWRDQQLCTPKPEPAEELAMLREQLSIALEMLWRDPQLCPPKPEPAEELAMLREQLSTALEMLQIMQEELQAAHDALAALQPVKPPANAAD
jgi:hypothetical protein